MKKVIIVCPLTLTHINYAHKTDNPYYQFIKKNTVSFAQSLSPQEKTECLDFLIGRAEPKRSWLERLNACFDALYAKFMQAYQACISNRTIQLTDDANHVDEFGIYVVLGVYRIIYKHAFKDIELKGLPSNNIWATPNELDAECLSHIHN